MVNMHRLMTRKVKLTCKQHTRSRGLGSRFTAGKASTTASATKQERTAKGEKRIVIELRIGELEVRLCAWCTVPFNRTFLYLSPQWSTREIATPVGPKMGLPGYNSHH